MLLLTLLKSQPVKSTMSCSRGHFSTPRRPVLPPVSNRTLHHPSFLPLYMAADFHHRDCDGLTVHPIIPAEFFFTDPTLGCGRRIPNTVTDLRVLDCFQLNTPPPVMSATLAPPNHPDPFRSGPYPTRDLGSSTWRMPTRYRRVQPSHFVLQLTQEEDRAITNLLKLHHQSPIPSAETLSAAQMGFSNVAGSQQDSNSRLFLQGPADLTPVYRPLGSDGRCPREVEQRRGWSDAELEVADTLLSCFILSDDDKIWGQNNHEESGGFPEVRGQTLSDSEGDAVHVLLSLGDISAVDIVQ
ncbi:uncharacterized protein LOC113157670 [Anabas testudineus]|uniref:uncharacterized protein LOC113157670 n=1 Tax=Anabas testudineus TaxID=64144 RepID=UPI000E45E204|nr:uncharacterized protein LOC113157670 [Anabas testudineus]